MILWLFMFFDILQPRSKSAEESRIFNAVHSHEGKLMNHKIKFYFK